MSASMTAVKPVGQAVGMDEVPDPQVPERAFRRTYTAKYKRDILAEYEAQATEGTPPDYIAIRGFLQEVLKEEVRKRPKPEGTDVPAETPSKPVKSPEKSTPKGSTGKQ